MYNGSTRTYRQEKSPRRPSSGTGDKRTSNQERLRLCQLLICLLLFLAVFVGKGIFPSKLIQLRDNILSMITSDTDFRSAFSSLGDALSGDPVLDRLEDFCIEVFGTGEPLADDQEKEISPALTSMATVEDSFLSGNPDEQEITDHLLYRSAWKIPMKTLEPESQSLDESVQTHTEPEVQAVPAAGTLVRKADYSGQVLPNNYTMDQLSLGSLETVTPVLGYINSEYGYREHPVNGKYQFHGGIDISGKTGDAIQAFAAGTVEYVGEDDSYGLYLQLDHGNGIKSFYAHCSAVCVKKGQNVAMGETIANVGSSGTATGPHLHLELKFNKMHLNPIYYITYLSRQ